MQHPWCPRSHWTIFFTKQIEVSEKRLTLRESIIVIPDDMYRMYTKNQFVIYSSFLQVIQSLMHGIIINFQKKKWFCLAKHTFNSALNGERCSIGKSSVVLCYNGEVLFNILLEHFSLTWRSSKFFIDDYCDCHQSRYIKLSGTQ